MHFINLSRQAHRDRDFHRYLNTIFADSIRLGGNSEIFLIFIERKLKMVASSLTCTEFMTYKSTNHYHANSESPRAPLENFVILS